ncbi:hypothetical protein, partial [Streptomyces clavuligerus]
CQPPSSAPFPRGGFLALNPIAYPPCACPDPRCTLKEPRRREDGNAENYGDSSALVGLRKRMRADNERRNTFGNHGR